MKIDRDEECGSCGLPRHAHWGGYQSFAAGRCAGFQSNASTKLRAAAPDMLAELKQCEDMLVGAIPHASKIRDLLMKRVQSVRAVIAKVEG